jgi:hypothetical protein
MELTEPFDAAVVAVAHSTEFTTPKRTSLPSIAPPLCPAVAWVSTPSVASRGLGCVSAHRPNTRNPKNSTVMAAYTAQPWRMSPTIRPNVKHSPPEITRIASASNRFESGVGFSSGWAEFVL